MNGPTTIRRAVPHDGDVVLEMMREIAAEEGVGAVGIDAHHWRTLLDRDDVIVFVAERNGVAVGYVSAIIQLHLWTGGDLVALDDLYVRPGHRDAGIGRSLITAIAAIAAPHNMVIKWGVESGNHHAQRFYARLGADLRTKTLAVWTPAAYRPHLPVATARHRDRPAG